MKINDLQLSWLRSLIIGTDGLRPGSLSRKGIAVVCLSIFFIALGVRFLQFQNNWITADAMMSRLTARYMDEAQFLLNGDTVSFVYGAHAAPDASILAHPPGYPILIALIHKVSGNSSRVLRLFQVACDSAAAVLVFLIVFTLLNTGVAASAGLLVALSPQLAFNCLPLLPDSLSAVFILLAIYLIVLTSRRPHIATILAAGASLGVSCWLRANALLLAPFLCLLIFVLFESAKRWRYSLAIVGAAFLIIAPITIRNAIVFRSFIPLTLGGGLNLVEGIADYDPENRFKLEATDDGVNRQEAELYGRPDYVSGLYKPDGVLRERSRYARGLSVVRSNKFWFLGITLRRAASMLRYERVPIVSVEPTVTHSLEITNETELVSSSSPTELLAGLSSVSGQARLSLSDDNRALRITGDDSEQGTQFVSAPINIKRKSDLVLRLPIRSEQGRMVIKVKSVGKDVTLASATIPDTMIPTAPTKDHMTLVQLPFVSDDTDQVRLVLANAGVKQSLPIIQIGDMEMYRLGSASYLWTRYPRWLLKIAQKFFTTGWMLTLTLMGIALLALARRWRILAIALVVPAYYLCVHSPLHVEFRYTLAMNYFFLILAAVALNCITLKSWQLAQRVWIPLRRGQPL